MAETENICPSCGKVMQPGQICTDCTVTDFKVSDSLSADWLATNGKTAQLPGQAFLIETSSAKQHMLSDTKCKIGRDPTNHIVITEDQFSSRFHAWITYEEDHFFIEDLGSTNGTLLNGSPLINRRPLVNGDQVRIGRGEFTFRTGNPRVVSPVSHSRQSSSSQ